MYYLFDRAPTGELNSSPSSPSPRPQSAFAAALTHQGIVATYGEDDFGYIIRQSSTGEYHFVYFCAGKYDSVSIGYSSQAIATRNAYLDSKSRGISKRDLHWLRELRLQSEGLALEENRRAKSGGEADQILRQRAEALEAENRALRAETEASLARLEDLKLQADLSIERSPRDVAEARYASLLVASFGDSKRGYLILRSVTGLYRFLRYTGVTHKMGSGYGTQRGAIQGAYEDCQRQLSYEAHWDWVVDLKESAQSLSPRPLR